MHISTEPRVVTTTHGKHLMRWQPMGRRLAVAHAHWHRRCRISRGRNNWLYACTHIQRCLPACHTRTDSCVRHMITVCECVNTMRVLWCKRLKLIFALLADTIFLSVSFIFNSFATNRQTNKHTWDTCTLSAWSSPPSTLLSRVIMLCNMRSYYMLPGWLAKVVVVVVDVVGFDILCMCVCLCWWRPGKEMHGIYVYLCSQSNILWLVCNASRCRLCMRLFVSFDLIWKCVCMCLCVWVFLRKWIGKSRIVTGSVRTFVVSRRRHSFGRASCLSSSTLQSGNERMGIE